MELLRPDPERETRRRLRYLPADAEVPGHLEDVVDAVHRHRLDGGDVEREHERLAEAERAALEAISVEGRPAAAEVGRHVHQHRRRGECAVVDAGHVVDRLEGRPGLAPAGLQDVPFRVELLVGVGVVVVGAADVGEDLAGPVVEGRQRAVVEVLAAQVGHPGGVRDADLLGVALRIRRAGQDRHRLDPLLGRLLHRVVEGGDDPVTARLERCAGLGLLAAEDAGQLVADAQDEVRRPPDRGRLLRQHDRLLLGRVVVGVGVLALRQHGARLHQLENVVAPHHDVAGGRHHERPVLARDRVAHQVVGGG